MKKIAQAQQDPSFLESRITALVQHVHVQMLRFASWYDTKRIANEEQYTQAGEDLKAIADVAKEVKAEQKKIVDPINNIIKKARAVTKPLDTLREHIEDNLMIPYAAEKKRAEIAKAEKRAAREEAKGNEQLAEDIRAHAAETPATPAIDGLQTRSYWRARVVDLDAFLRAFLNKDPRCLTASVDLAEAIEKAMGRLARTAKDGSQAPAGVEFWQEEGYARIDR